MLSQRISKAALAVATSTEEINRQRHQEELDSSLALWILSQKGLRHGDRRGLPGKNSNEVNNLLNSIEPHYQVIATEASSLLTASRLERDAGPKLMAFIRPILEHEKHFLQGMDSIVQQYEIESKSIPKRLQLMDGLQYFPHGGTKDD